MCSSSSSSLSFGVALVVVAFWCSVGTAQPVTTLDLENAAADNSSWLTYGRDYYGQRFVRLNQITPANVNRLHPAWVFATGGENRGFLMPAWIDTHVHIGTHFEPDGRFHGLTSAIDESRRHTFSMGSRAPTAACRRASPPCRAWAPCPDGILSTASSVTGSPQVMPVGGCCSPSGW